MSISKNLAKVLQRYRMEHRLSIQGLADKIGITKSSAERYLSGKGNPRSDTLELISKRTGIPLTELVSDPLPGQERTETIIRAARELSCLPAGRVEDGIHCLYSLTNLFTREL